MNLVNQSSPTVSIVMPTYNRADLLPKTIASILSQDFEDFELLIVDDGSTDNSAEVIKEIQEQDPRVRYWSLPENRGIGHARHTGTQHVSGKYIATADSDDLWLPGKLKTQVGIMEQHPEIEILFGNFWDIDHLKGTVASAFVLGQAGMKHLDVCQVDNDLYLVNSGIETGILLINFLQLGTMLLRASVLNEIGSFDTALSGPEDFEFCWRAAVLGAQYAYINRLLVERHIHESSITVRKSNHALQKLEALKICHRTCETARRPELHRNIRATEQRTWRRLLWIYGHNGQRAEALRAYSKSLQCGFSSRNLFVLASALLGPQAASLSLSFVNRVHSAS